MVLRVEACWATRAIVATTLVLASYLDYRYRDVEPIIWYVVIRAALPLGLLCFLRTSYPLEAAIVGNAAALIVAGGLYFAGLLGGGDVMAITLIALLTPSSPGELLPPSLLALLYGSLIVALVMPAMCIYNMLRADRRSTLVRLAAEHGALKAIFTCFTSIPLRVEVAICRGWFYPAKHEVGHPYKIIESDPPELLAEIAASRGSDSPVWVTPGLPQIAFILVGYTIAILLGDNIVKALIR